MTSIVFSHRGHREHRAKDKKDFSVANLYFISLAEIPH